MRLFVPVLAAGLAVFTLSAPVAGQRADDQIAPKSVELQHQVAAPGMHPDQDGLEIGLLQAAGKLQPVGTLGFGQRGQHLCATSEQLRRYPA